MLVFLNDRDRGWVFPVVYKSHPASDRGSARKKCLIERVTRAFGILGVVRFLEGFYILVLSPLSLSIPIPDGDESTGGGAFRL